MKQPHTETSIDHTEDQQNTGNHKVPGAEDAGGADRFGGTRSGAENVEGGAAATGDQKGTGPNDAPAKGVATGGTKETHPERDERGRL